jgi:hypothetical protein
VIDGEELFHLLYNPFFNEWLSKRKDYIKYDKLQKMQKKKKSKGFSPTKPTDATQNQQDFSNKARDQYYMKEVRTFGEVYNSIKKETEEYQKSKIGKRVPLVVESEEEEYTDSDHEIGEIPEDLEYVDDNDIGYQDREVLNGRILGLINVF